MIHSLLVRLLAICLLFSGAVLADEGKGGGADAAWAEIENELRGPADQPKSKEEGMAMMKAHIERIDRLAADFARNFPTDPRRWKIATQVLSNYPLREVIGLPAKSMADARKVLAEILESRDADPETKSEASFRMVITFVGEMKAGNISLADLEKAIEAHRSAYPEYKGNAQLDAVITGAKREQMLKAKPLELKFTAVDGREVDLAKMRGKVVLVAFWSTWCRPCMADMPSLVKIYERFHTKDFEIVGVSLDDDKARLESVTKELGMAWPQHFDGKGLRNEIGQKLGIQSIPEWWLVNKSGIVVDTDARENLAAKIEKLLAE